MGVSGLGEAGVDMLAKTALFKNLTETRIYYTQFDEKLIENEESINVSINLSLFSYQTGGISYTAYERGICGRTRLFIVLKVNIDNPQDISLDAA